MRYTPGVRTVSTRHTPGVRLGDAVETISAF